jgi:hypothetical protein
MRSRITDVSGIFVCSVCIPSFYDLSFTYVFCRSDPQGVVDWCFIIDVSYYHGLILSSRWYSTLRQYHHGTSTLVALARRSSPVHTPLLAPRACCRAFISTYSYFAAIVIEQKHSNQFVSAFPLLAITAEIVKINYDLYLIPHRKMKL